MAEPTEAQMHEQFQERFNSLPKVVQEAITSADVEAHLRKLADEHKLHIDQWQILENVVMLTLLGFQRFEDLKANIQSHIQLDDATAESISTDVSRIVFEPIRGELEKTLEHPVMQGIGDRDQRKGGRETQTPAAPPTPPAPKPDQSAVRAPAAANYKPGESSSVRKDIHSDPYRESLV